MDSKGLTQQVWDVHTHPVPLGGKPLTSQPLECPAYENVWFSWGWAE